jgi:hypothetical protein
LKPTHRPPQPAEAGDPANGLPTPDDFPKLALLGDTCTDVLREIGCEFLGLVFLIPTPSRTGIFAVVPDGMPAELAGELIKAAAKCTLEGKGVPK